MLRRNPTIGVRKAKYYSMNYYEKLVNRVKRLMDENPKSAMGMDMASFRIIAKSPNFKSLSKKRPKAAQGVSTVVFQRPSQKAAWIL